MSDAGRPSIAECLEMMRKGNPQVAEDGFAYIRPRAKDHINQLMGEYGREANHSVQCMLLELIGEARSHRAFEFLKKEAQAEDGAIRSWAVRGLEKLGTHEARDFLFKHDQAAIE